MTTNNPPIAAWAPSSALAKLASRHNNAPCILTDGPAEFNDVALVRLSDCERLQADRERLQAEHEKLRNLLRHAQPIIKAHAGASHMLDGFRPKRNQWDELVEAIDAAMQEDKP